MADLEICVIDKETGLLYEWNGARTINIYNLYQYAMTTLHDYPPKNATDKFGFDMWTLSEDTITEFVDSVERHVVGEGME